MLNSAIPATMDRDAIYYLSGPMTGYEGYNYTAFQDTQEFLELCGLRIESPHTNPWPPGHEIMSVEELWEEMMKLAYAQMALCSGIILIRGWSASRGARAELLKMIEDGGSVYYFDDEHNRVVDMNRKIAA